MKNMRTGSSPGDRVAVLACLQRRRWGEDGEVDPRRDSLDSEEGCSAHIVTERTNVRRTSGDDNNSVI